MHVKLPVVGLCVALAAVGATAGWLSYNLLSNPVVNLAPPGLELFAAACTAMLSGAAGILLAPSHPRQEWLPPEPTPMRIAMIVLAVGTLAGVLVTCRVSLRTLATGAAGGLLCAVPFVPAAMGIVSAMRHASLARPGSIVARANRRAVLCVFAVTLGCTSALALPDWPAAVEGVRPEPRGALLLTVVAGLFVTGLVLADLFTMGRIRRLNARAAEMERRPAEDATLPGPREDFGLGEQVAAEMAPSLSYRIAEHPVALIVGSAGEALAALRRSLVWGAIGLGLLEAVAIGHGLARGVDIDAFYSAWLCDSGRLGACRQAALLSERAGHPDEEAIRLHKVACYRGDERSCLAMNLLHRRNGPLW